MDYKIKILSLERRKDRQEKFIKEFSDYNFDYEFHWGIDGKKYQLTEYDKEWIVGNDGEIVGIHMESLVATMHSHNNILRDCISDGIPYVVFEDDAKLLKPLDFSFDDIVKKELDVFWLIPNKRSILAYVVWPSGAKKLIEATDKRGGLRYGFDYMWHELKNTGLLKEENIWDDYFYQFSGDEDSDITTMLYYDMPQPRLY